jgi:lysophospholipase L1-like esterase
MSAVATVIVFLIVGLDLHSATQFPYLLDGIDRPLAAFLGDSYTKGFGASEPEKRWTSLVAQKMGWGEDNFGVGGTGYLAAWANAEYPQGVNYLGRLDEVVASNPDIVVVAGGQNDKSLLPSDRKMVFDAVADTFIQLRQRLPTARIVAVGPSSGALVPPWLVELDDQVQAAARAAGADYVSLISPTPVIQQYMLLTDGHVDDSGHAAIADRVLSVLASSG